MSEFHDDRMLLEFYFLGYLWTFKLKLNVVMLGLGHEFLWITIEQSFVVYREL